MGDCGAFRCAELRHEKGASGFFFHTYCCLTTREMAAVSASRWLSGSQLKCQTAVVSTPKS